MASKYLVGLLLGSTVLAAGCRRTSSAAPTEGVVGRPGGPAEVRFRQDRLYSYGVELASKLSYGPGPGLELSLAGTLRVQPVSHFDSELWLSFRDVSFGAVPETAARQYADLARELARDFVLSRTRGAIKAVRGPADVSVFAANIVWTIASAFELPLPPGETEGAWSAESRDASGRYLAEYKRLDGHRYSRKKLRYQAMPVQGPGNDVVLTMTPLVRRSRGEISLLDGALGSASYEEELESQLGQTARARASNRLQLTLRQAEPAPAREDRAIRSALVLLEAGGPGVADGDRRALDQSKVGNFTFDTAVARLEAIVREPHPLLVSESTKKASSPAQNARRDRRLAEHNRAFTALSAILRSQPDTVPRALALVRRKPALARTLVDALSGADTETVQQALLALSRDAREPVSLRKLAASALTGVENPAETTVRALMEMLSDPELRTQAIYGLGTQARILRERGKTGLGAQASQALVGELRKATGPVERVDLLRGIANSGFADALPAVRPLLTDEDEIVRGAAVEALRLMDDPRVDGLIAERLTDEKRPTALRAALNAAKTRPPHELIARALAEVATTDRDDHSRFAAIELMGRWRPHQPALRQVLQRVAESDAVPAVREAARAAL